MQAIRKFSELERVLAEDSRLSAMWQLRSGAGQPPVSVTTPHAVPVAGTVSSQLAMK
jgi:hypothetical protein